MHYLEECNGAGGRVGKGGEEHLRLAVAFALFVLAPAGSPL